MTRSDYLTKARGWHYHECGCDDLFTCQTDSASKWRRSLGDASAFNGYAR